MIFLTVGTQLPFDRLVRAVDDWAGRSGAAVFAQIADPDPYRPRHLDWVAHLDPAAFGDAVARAEAIVSHAGMGTIITAMTHAKPVLILPRRAELGEHRNDHQIATAHRFADRPNVSVVWDQDALPAALSSLCQGKDARGPRLDDQADPKLVAAIREKIMAA